MAHLEFIILHHIIVVQTGRDVCQTKVNFRNLGGRYRRLHHTFLHLDVCFRQIANVYETFSNKTKAPWLLKMTKIAQLCLLHPKIIIGKNIFVIFQTSILGVNQVNQITVILVSIAALSSITSSQIVWLLFSPYSGMADERSWF